MKINYDPQETYTVFHIKQSGDSGRGYFPCRVRKMFEYLGVASFDECKASQYKDYVILSNKYSNDEPNTSFPKHNGRCIMVEVVEGELQSISEVYVTEVLSDKNTRVSEFTNMGYKPGKFTVPTLEDLKEESEED